jgi:predicted GNAT family acetyltransferase
MLNDIQEFWRTDFSTEQVIEQMSTTTWAGVKINGELAAIGRMRLAGEVGHVPTVATHQAHRNRGYATSIVSYLVEHILEKIPVAIIYVLGDNAPAVKVYGRVGFKPYRRYYLMRGNRR